MFLFQAPLASFQHFHLLLHQKKKREREKITVMIALWRETRLYGEELCFGSSGCAGVEEVCTASSRKHIKAALWCRITRFLRKPVNRCDAFDIRRHHVFLLFCYRPLLKNSHITPFFSFYLLLRACKIQARDVILWHHHAAPVMTVLVLLSSLRACCLFLQNLQQMLSAFLTCNKSISCKKEAQTP